METINYTVNKRSFEIRNPTLGEWIAVQAFEQGKPASLRYGVTLETASDMHTQNGDSAVDALIELVKEELARSTTAT